MSIRTQIGSVLLVACGLVGFAGPAQATQIITWTTYDKSWEYLCSWCGDGSSYSWTMDINSTHGSPGGALFSPGWIVTGATLTVWLFDDARYDGPETASFDLDGSLDAKAGNGAFKFDLSQFLSDGILLATVSAFSGDFYYQKSRLIVTAYSVPEPSSLALLGLGLLGVGFYARRRVGK